MFHFNNLYTKVISFIDYLHKDIQNKYEDQIPEINKDKEDNLCKIWTSTKLYNIIDKFPEVKYNRSKA